MTVATSARRFSASRPRQRHVWVCRDLGNGNQRDTYIWWFWSRQDARDQWQLHELYQPQWAKLAKPVKWPLALVKRWYDDGGADELSAHYVRKKSA